MSYQGRSNFPGGFRTGVSIQGIPLNWMVSNKALWVDSKTGGDGNKGTFDRPVATLQKAIDLSTTNVYDTIFVKEGHAETITAAGAITFASKIGVKVFGLGYGKARPTITFGTNATATILMNAANVAMCNMRFSANVASVAACMVVSATGVVIDSCDFVDTASAKEWLSPIKVTSTTANVADELMVTNNRWKSASANPTSFVNLAATLDKVNVSNNIVNHEGTLVCQLVASATTKLLTDFECIGNMLNHKMTALELFLSNDGTTNTGIVAHNRCGCADVTGVQDPGWDAAGYRLFDNLVSTVDNLSGYVNPAIDVNL